MSTLTALETIGITTRKGITSQVLVGGPATGAPILALHGAGGHLLGEPVLQRLAAAGYRVASPVWPGYGDEPTETMIEDMLDFALHGADVALALGSERPHLVGHSMGGMIAAEMAALAPQSYGKVALLAPVGLWLDETPIPDIFSMLPFEFPEYMFHDPASGAAMLTGGLDFNDVEAIKNFLILNSRRLGTAGKILFPIPNRRLAKRLYRLSNPLSLIWGESDRLVPLVYAQEWRRLVPHAEIRLIDAAGHMSPYEQPDAVAAAIAEFLES